MGICVYFEFCEHAKKCVEHDVEYAKLFCKSSNHEHCETYKQGVDFASGKEKI